MVSDPVYCDTWCKLSHGDGGLMYVALGCAVAMVIEAAILALLLGKLRDRGFVVAPLGVAGIALLLAVVCLLAYLGADGYKTFPLPLIGGAGGYTHELAIPVAAAAIASAVCVFGGIWRLLGFDAVQRVREGLHSEEPPRWRP